MNEKQVRVIDAIEALRGDWPATMDEIRRSVNRKQFDGDDGAIAQAVAFQRRREKSVDEAGGPVRELVASIRALDESTSPRPLISDATLAKIVRAAHAARNHDSEAWDSCLALAVSGNYADALDEARGLVPPAEADPTGTFDAPLHALVDALESANAEAARNSATHDTERPQADAP